MVTRTAMLCPIELNESSAPHMKLPGSVLGPAQCLAAEPALAAPAVALAAADRGEVLEHPEHRDLIAQAAGKGFVRRFRFALSAVQSQVSSRGRQRHWRYQTVCMHCGELPGPAENSCSAMIRTEMHLCAKH